MLYLNSDLLYENFNIKQKGIIIMSAQTRERFLILPTEEVLRFFSEFKGTFTIGTLGHKIDTRGVIKEKSNEIFTAFSHMIVFTKKELARQFTVGECNLIVDSIKGSFYNPTISAKYFLSNKIEEFILFKESKLGRADVEALNKKLDELSEFQAYVLLLETYEYIFSEDDAAAEEDKLMKYFLCKREEDN